MSSCKDCIYCYVDSNVIPYAYCALGIVKFFDLSDDEEMFLCAETCSEFETDMETSLDVVDNITIADLM